MASLVRPLAVTVALALALALTACGQKPGIHVEGAATQGATAAVAAQPNATTLAADVEGVTQPQVGSSSPGPDDGSAAGSMTPSAGAVAPSRPATQFSEGDDAAPSAGQPSAAPAGDQSQEAGRVRGSDRTGVTADVISFGTHAPVTGAAPLPTTSFEKSGDLYWRNLIDREGGDALGRTKVEMIFRDDKYDPASARQVCRELAATVFTMAGGGGTDQIQACGELANRLQVPYFSAGVTEAGLRGLDWYFASSMTYRQQGPLLAQVAARHPDLAGRRFAAIVTDTPNFDDAVDGWLEGVAAQNLDYATTLRHPKGDTSWYASYAKSLADQGVEVVFILSSPVDYIRFAQQSQQLGIDFQFIGVGVSMGLNAVLNSGCDFVDKGIFLSPFPGLDWARTNVPEFFEAGADFGVPTDDIALALWGANASLHGLLERYRSAYGTDLTREDFRDLVASSQGVSGGVLPDVSYSPDDHFGASTAHLLRANCEIGEYETLATFVDSF